MSTRPADQSNHAQAVWRKKLDSDGGQLAGIGPSSKMKPVTNKQLAKVARAILCLVVLVVVQGCTTFQSSESGKSWSQVAAEEGRQQPLDESPYGDWNMLP
jgi:hypothetical protein